MSDAPGEIETVPHKGVIFSGPFEEGRIQKSKLTVKNSGTAPMAYQAKTKFVKGALALSVSPPHGELEPGQATTLMVVCTPGAGNIVPSTNDQVIIEWCNRPSSVGPNTAFDADWFMGDGIVRRKNMKVDYNV